MNTYLASKPRYEILDGLRGVAAMMVVAFHLLETYYHMGPDQSINHGYLAVDFFFALSGFVNGMALKKPEDKTLEETMQYFKTVKGVTNVEYDNIIRLTDPVKPRLEIQ